VLDLPFFENLALGRERRPPWSRRGLLDRSALCDAARTAARDLTIVPADPAAPLRSFSGGNQQKVIVARELDGSPVALVAAQPTRGVDLGAVEFIHHLLIRERDRGLAVLLISAELSEVIALSDRIAVLYRGRIAGLFEAGEADEDTLGRLMLTGAGA
jgi:simple sugar transport system ATP-binding protein